MSSKYCEFDKKFCLGSGELSRVLDVSAKLLLPKYADALLGNFAKGFKSGVYSIESKDQRNKKISVRFRCNSLACRKQYKIWCLKEDIFEGQDLNWVVLSDNTVCDHSCEAPRSRNITGEKREQFKEELKKKSIGEVYRAAVSSDKAEDLQEGITAVPNRNILKMIRRDMMKTNDLHLNPVIDVMLRAEAEDIDKRFINLSVSPFRCSLISEAQVVSATTNVKHQGALQLRRLHFDATGSILAKNAKENPEMMLYFLIFPLKTNIENKYNLRFNLAEFISETQTSFAIEVFLRNVVNLIERVNGTSFQLIHEIVIDWSWAEINAVIKAFNNMTVKDYIQECYNLMITTDKTMDGFVTVLECSSHLTKNMLTDIKKYFDSYEDQKTICRMLGKLFDCTTWSEAKTSVCYLIGVLLSPTITTKVRDALKTFEDYEYEWMKLEVYVPATNEQHFKKADLKEIYKDSIFYQVIS